ncbi:hypothetical protein LEMLEM_LOCUS26225 [Lemmus lemmus]
MNSGLQGLGFKHLYLRSCLTTRVSSLQSKLAKGSPSA